MAKDKRNLHYGSLKGLTLKQTGKWFGARYGSDGSSKNWSNSAGETSLFNHSPTTFGSASREEARKWLEANETHTVPDGCVLSNAELMALPLYMRDGTVRVFSHSLDATQMANGLASRRDVEALVLHHAITDGLVVKVPTNSLSMHKTLVDVITKELVSGT